MAKTKTKATTKPAPAPVFERPPLKPYTLTLELDIDAAGHHTAQLLAADITAAVNDAAFQFCEHAVLVYRVVSSIDQLPEIK